MMTTLVAVAQVFYNLLFASAIMLCIFLPNICFRPSKPRKRD
jgi:hypothetical protein